MYEDGVLTPKVGGDMLTEVRDGLSRAQKQLSPKFFYDERGSELFDEITTLPEYYPTRIERMLLARHARELLTAYRPRALIELGAGSADKTGILLDAMTGDDRWYIPIDISVTYLSEVVARIGAEYPHLRILPVEADLSQGPVVPPDMPKPALIAFLGSTIGNFERAAATRLLEAVRRAMSPDDRLLLGVDLRKDVAVLEAAYNDSRGVTAAFNRNVLHVLNRELGADFDVDAFDHVAFYNRDRHRIEMHLRSVVDQSVTIPDAGVFEFRRGETIRTEISCKYDRETIETLFERAGLDIEVWQTDPENLYALVIGRVKR
ncbi:MAG: L-histidine N(alpha)-methyltransferase [Longimicrobiales bacterium]